MTIIAVIDFETTGLDPKVDKVIEMALVTIDDLGYELLRSQWRFDPSIVIPPQSSAIHHLTAEDVEGRPSFDENQWVHSVIVNTDVFAAHNAKFDSAFVPWETRPFICTYKCAVHFFPNLPNHSNQTARYALGLKPDLPAGLAPHSALYDAVVTASLLRKLLEHYTVEHLIKISSEPLLLPKVKFGKYIDKEWKDVPKDYLDWILRQGNFDEDVIYTAQHWRNKK